MQAQDRSNARMEDSGFGGRAQGCSCPKPSTGGASCAKQPMFVIEGSVKIASSLPCTKPAVCLKALHTADKACNNEIEEAYKRPTCIVCYLPT